MPGFVGACSVGAGPTTTNQFAKQTIRRLLDGTDAETFAAIPPASYGPWAETVRLLREAYAEGKAGATAEQDAGKRGTQAVITVYCALVRVNEQLTQLMAGDEAAPRKSFKIKELLTANYPPVKFIIPGLLPVGLSILAGRPKEGKSWLALQIALAAYLGGTVLGQAVPRLKVLFLGLEDTEHRLSDRLKKLLDGMFGGQIPELQEYGDVDINIDWSPLSEQGLADLHDAMDRVGYDLVIIDTFSRILGRGDQMD